MLHDFSIIHRRKPLVFATPEFPVWSTCLRSLAFAPAIEAQAHDETFAQGHAYRFLLEIVCGLHSPIVGETEVFGQFKNFAREWALAEPKRLTLIQRLLSDAKSIRAQYLSGLGTQSYGSWLRKNLSVAEVHVLGAGHLTQEILPYLQKHAQSVHLHVRREQALDFHQGPVHLLTHSAFRQGALVIAAPMKAQEVEAWLGGRNPVQIFDLRDTSCSDPLRLTGSQHRLKDIFTQIEQNKSRLQPLIHEVRGEIRLRSERLAEQTLIRPQGWDDLCA